MADDGDRNKTPTTMTVPHKRLMSLLRILGFEPEEELQVGRYSIDCYVREIHCGFECDGKRFHAGVAKGKKDRARDAWIFENAGIPLMRIESDAIQWQMWDDRVDDRGNPVKGLKTLIMEFVEKHAKNADRRMDKARALGVL